MLCKTTPILIAFWLAILVPACAQPPDTTSPEQNPPRRRALLVGINDYSASRLRHDGKSKKSPRSSWPSLSGAVNDVEAIRDMLKASFGFQDEHVHLLTDQGATREAILQAIEEHLLKPARKDDVVLFYYSGHGSQVRNSKSDESDLLDESIVPADAPLGEPDIRDKELRPLFNKILDRKAHLVIVFDSCHSGSGARGLPSGARSRRVKPDLHDVADGSAYGPKPEERGALVLSASQDDELAWEVNTENDEAHGAFTWSLLKAMRSAAQGESSERIFLRARAWLQSANKFQEPVLAGSPERRRAPLFGGRTDQQDAETVVMVESVGDDRTVVLRAGWANGLDAGSELRKLPDAKQPAPQGPWLQVVDVQGLGHSTARILDRYAGPPGTDSSEEVQTGDLFEIFSWVAPQGSVLRVWIPEIAETSAAYHLAKDLFELAGNGQFRWVDDPVQELIGETSIHVLRWHRGQWQLISPADGGELRSLGAAPSPQEVVSHLSRDTRLFVHLPAPSSLVEKIEIGSQTRHGAVEPTEDPAAADYQLVGRLHGDALVYAWVRPETNDADEWRSGMPSRSAWCGPNDITYSLAGRLERHVLRLAKIRAWHELQPPPNQEFPYRLGLRDVESGRLQAARLREEREDLREGNRYTIVLQLSEELAASGVRVRERYVYAFSIDSVGNSVLLYPPSPWGNIENRFPRFPGTAPAEIALGDDSAFDVIEPLGTDTFFLLTTAEPLLNPMVLQYEGVRGRGPEGSTSFEEFLSLTGGARAIRPSSTTSMKWFIEKKVFRTVPVVP